MGLYLLLSLNLFGRHGNEAFSSLGVEDWKNFLRLHINEKGGGAVNQGQDGRFEQTPKIMQQEGQSLIFVV